jgi:hypothetical protein
MPLGAVLRHSPIHSRSNNEWSNSDICIPVWQALPGYGVANVKSTPLASTVVGDKMALASS